jgi:hypothetical protein
MNRKAILKLIDENNAEISKLQARIKECLAQDKWLHGQLPLEPVKAYIGHDKMEQRWENEGGR